MPVNFHTLAYDAFSKILIFKNTLHIRFLLEKFYKSKLESPSMSRTKIVLNEGASRFQTLDPTTLGRPFHLLPSFARLLESELADYVNQEMNRRYHAHFVLRSIEQQLPNKEKHGFWTWHRAAEATVGINIDRPLLLRILDYRYGVHSATASRAEQDTIPPETETEHRLARLIGERLTARLIYAIHRLGKNFTPNAQPLYLAESLPYAPSSPPAWKISVRIGERETREHWTVTLLLDNATFEHLLKSLADQRQTTRIGHAQHSAPFAEQARVQLHAQLLEKRLTLGDIIDLKVGATLPITLHTRATVHIGTTRIFSALVAEDRGKLCLTTFDDTE